MTAGRTLLRVVAVTNGRAASTTSPRRNAGASLVAVIVPSPHALGGVRLQGQPFRYFRRSSVRHLLIALRQQGFEFLPLASLQPLGERQAHNLAAVATNAPRRIVYRAKEIGWQGQHDSFHADAPALIV